MIASVCRGCFREGLDRIRESLGPFSKLERTPLSRDCYRCGKVCSIHHVVRIEVDIETTTIAIDIARGIGLSLLKKPGWERRLRDRTIAEGERLRREAENAFLKPKTKLVEPPKPQTDFGDLFDLEEDE